MSEEYNDEMQGLSSWIKNNLRIIVSIAIVVLVAGAIYSYSKRSEEQLALNNSDQTMSEEEMLKEILGESDESKPEEAKQEDATEEQVASQEVTETKAEEVSENQPAVEEKNEVVEEETKEAEIVKEEAVEEVVIEEVKEAEATKEIVAATNVSRETEGSFIEIATSGEGLTHLARKALNDYLEKNTDSELSQEHKIYIEDYLRKKVDSQEKVHVGTSVEFSKSLIQEAVEKSKSLSDNQIKNLQKYSARVQ